MRVDERRSRMTLDDGDFFYLTGIWSASLGDWPLSSPSRCKQIDKHRAMRKDMEPKSCACGYELAGCDRARRHASGWAGRADVYCPKVWPCAIEAIWLADPSETALLWLPGGSAVLQLRFFTATLPRPVAEVRRNPSPQPGPTFKT